MGSASSTRFSSILGRFLLSFIALAPACGDGGWGSEPDTRLEPRRDVPAAVDTAVDTTVDDDVAGVCGQGPGNELGVGKPCTKGGKQCPQGLSCDADLDAQGVGVCIKLPCKPDVADDCGSNAGCCKPTGSPLNVCIHDDCLPPECADLRGN